MKNIFAKTMTAFLVVALALAAIPASSAFAADEDPPAPTNEKLEKAWARVLKLYERTGKAFEDTDAHIAKFQGMIDKAAENGRDVSDLQAALDAYEAALTSTRPQYEALGTVISAHAGFDAEGKVTDAEQAKATLTETRDQMKAVKESMGETFKALREAIKAFREENKPEEPPKERDS